MRSLDEDSVKRALKTPTRTADQSTLVAGDWCYVWRSTNTHNGWSGPGAIVAVGPHQRTSQSSRLEVALAVDLFLAGAWCLANYQAALGDTAPMSAARLQSAAPQDLRSVSAVGHVVCIMASRRADAS